MTETAPRANIVTRGQSGPKMAAVRAGMKTLDRVAPHVSARYVARMWCTLPRGRSRSLDLRPHRGVIDHLTIYGGREVVTETWGAGPVVYLVHGWGGWRGQLGAFVDPLVAAGFQVVAFDTPSHGEAGPGVLGSGRSTLREMMEGFEEVVQRFGAASGVVAHSLGTTSAARLELVNSVSPVRAFVAPAPDLSNYDSVLAGLLGFSERTSVHLRNQMEVLGHDRLNSFDLSRMGGGGELASTLIVHDRNDREAPYANAQVLAERWGARLHTTEGLGHQRLLADPAVISQVVGHLRQG